MLLLMSIMSRWKSIILDSLRYKLRHHGINITSIGGLEVEGTPQQRSGGSIHQGGIKKEHGDTPGGNIDGSL